jgi:hypothetical protein
MFGQLTFVHDGINDSNIVEVMMIEKKEKANTDREERG